MNTVPALVEGKNEDQLPPRTIAKQWRRVFEAGKAQNPPVAAVTSTALFYVAWCVRSGTPYFRKAAYSLPALYCTAGILTLGLVPYTFVAMRTTNNTLVSKSKVELEASEKNYKELDGLLHSWISLNWVRSLFPLAGSFVAILAVLS